MSQPRIYIIGGPNGAGKTTAAKVWLPPEVTFLNADEIALEYPARSGGDIAAGRILFERFDRLVGIRASFAVETTLSNRSLAGRLARVAESGYSVHLYFVWIPSADMAVEHVAHRVRAGGHNIPEHVIRRRYASGIRNLVGTYIPISDTWSVFANVVLGAPRLIAKGRRDDVVEVFDAATWGIILEEATNG